MDKTRPPRAHGGGCYGPRARSPSQFTVYLFSVPRRFALLVDAMQYARETPLPLAELTRELPQPARASLSGDRADAAAVHGRQSL